MNDKKRQTIEEHDENDNEIKTQEKPILSSNILKVAKDTLKSIINNTK